MEEGTPGVKGTHQDICPKCGEQRYISVTIQYRPKDDPIPPVWSWTCRRCGEQWKSE